MAKYFLMRLPVVRAEYVTGKMFLMASRSYPFQVLPDHEIQTHPEIINYFNKRTFSHLKRGIIFTAYLCPKGVPSINELALVRHFDCTDKRLCISTKSDDPTQVPFGESPKVTKRGSGKAGASMVVLSSTKPPPRHTHAGRS